MHADRCRFSVLREWLCKVASSNIIFRIQIFGRCSRRLEKHLSDLDDRATAIESSLRNLHTARLSSLPDANHFASINVTTALASPPASSQADSVRSMECRAQARGCRAVAGGLQEPSETQEPSQNGAYARYPRPRKAVVPCATVGRPVCESQVAPLHTSSLVRPQLYHRLCSILCTQCTTYCARCSTKVVLLMD